MQLFYFEKSEKLEKENTLAKMDVSIYTIVQSSLTLIIGTFISKFYFKEYVTWKNWVSLVLAIVACTISAKMSA